MAITYHASRRIQGLSNKITYENNFTAPATYEHTPSRIIVTGGEWRHQVQRGSERTGWLDTGLSSSGDNFVFTLKLRFPARSTGISGNTMYLYFSSTTSNQDSDAPSGSLGGNCIGFNLNTRGNGSSEDGITGVQAGNTYGYNLANDNNSFRYSDPSVEYTKYLKIVKNGTTVSMTIHDSESDMVAGIKTSGSDLSTGTDNAIGSMNNLRYFKWNNVVGGSVSTYAEVFIDDLKFYNNVTAIPDYDVKPKTTAIVNSYNVGASTIITFNENGIFRPTSSYNIEYLVIGGGGAGGGNNNGGGGGAGGYRTATGFAVTAQSYTITVGSGGSGNSTAGQAQSGSDSTFSTITSTGGGGGGGGNSNEAGSNGGSGGGAAYTTSTSSGGSGNTPSTTPSQGNNGGNGSNGTAYGGGGGGGSGSVGANATTTVGGNGGSGTSSSITGNAVIRAAGGGGGSNAVSGGSSGSGGSGGGGNGAYATGSLAATNGTTNTGSGGGGCQSANTTGGNGGSGIVILKIPNGSGYELSSPQVGSRFEETDTRKMYHLDDVDWKEENGNEATNYRSASWYEQLSGETP